MSINLTSSFVTVTVDMWVTVCLKVIDVAVVVVLKMLSKIVD